MPRKTAASSKYKNEPVMAVEESLTGFDYVNMDRRIKLYSTAAAHGTVDKWYDLIFAEDSDLMRLVSNISSKRLKNDENLRRGLEFLRNHYNSLIHPNVLTPVEIDDSLPSGSVKMHEYRAIPAGIMNRNQKGRFEPDHKARIHNTKYVELELPEREVIVGKIKIADIEKRLELPQVDQSDRIVLHNHQTAIAMRSSDVTSIVKNLYNPFRTVYVPITVSAASPIIRTQKNQENLES